MKSGSTSANVIQSKKTVAVIIAIAALLCLLLACIPLVPCLSITNRKNPKEQVLSRSALDGFVISYTHSVNKGRVHDYYTVLDDGTLSVYKTVFVSYGAGIPEAEETPGAVFTQTDSGYEITNLHRNVKTLVMAVGIIAEHAITIHDQDIYLKNLFAPQTSLIFKKQRVSLLHYYSKRRI